MKTWMWLSFLWVTVTLLGAFLDMAITGTQMATLNHLFQMKVFSMKDVSVLFVHLTVPLPNLEWFKDIASLATWNFSFFSGDLNMVRWVVWTPLTGGIVYLTVTQIGPAVFSVLADLRRAALG